MDATKRRRYMWMTAISSLSLILLGAFHIFFYMPITNGVSEFSIQQVVLQVLVFLTGITILPVMGLVIGCSHLFFQQQLAEKRAGMILLGLSIALLGLSMLYVTDSLSLLNLQLYPSLLMYAFVGVILFKPNIKWI